MADLLHLTRTADRAAYMLQFDRIARKLLNHHVLQTPQHTYRIRELEFYYHDIYHPDYYCHRHARQLGKDKWYFHRFNNADKYHNTRRKGLDITFGDEKSAYGGILIRTIENIDTKVVIDRIGLLVNQLIEDFGNAQTIQLIYDSNLDIFTADAPLKLVPTIQQHFDIFKKHRQNLNVKKQDTDRFFIDAAYNYFTYPLITPL